MRRLAAWLLEVAEMLYLHAHGWDRRGEHSTKYLPPDDYEFRRYEYYERGHAVNAQKQRRRGSAANRPRARRLDSARGLP